MKDGGVRVAAAVSSEGATEADFGGKCRRGEGGADPLSHGKRRTRKRLRSESEG